MTQEITKVISTKSIATRGMRIRLASSLILLMERSTKAGAPTRKLSFKKRSASVGLKNFLCLKKYPIQKMRIMGSILRKGVNTILKAVNERDAGIGPATRACPPKALRALWWIRQSAIAFGGEN